MDNKRILLIISGGIAAYKALELIRLIKKDGGHVRCILTSGGQKFITPLSVASLSGEKCYTDLFSLDDESEMGHIRLSREADLVVVAPASADIIGKMAHGLCNDLATTTLMATDKPVIIAPAMNPCMFENKTLQDNLTILKSRGIHVIAPDHGDMACGETGQGRLPAPETILKHIQDFFLKDKPLAGKHAVVTSGPTYEPIDPVRFLGNRSSGKQGHAIACALRDAGANVTLVTGPTALPDPSGMTTLHIETAQDMADTVSAVIRTDIAVCAAAVADYGVEASPQKQKKSERKGGLDIRFKTNPDILHMLSSRKNRPAIVVGFAAETENLIDHAREKLNRKMCDAIVANQVGTGDHPVFGQDDTTVHWITKTVSETYAGVTKTEVAAMITRKITAFFDAQQSKDQTA